MPARKPIEERRQYGTGPQARVQVGLRVPLDLLKRIDELADAHGLSRSDYIVKVAAGELEEIGLKARMDALERDVRERLDRVERLINLGA